MKRFLLIALVACVAGAAFAETDPVFSGEFSTYLGYSFEDEEPKLGDTAEIDLKLNATIDDWNTVSVEVELADALYWDDKHEDDFINMNNFMENGTVLLAPQKRGEDGALLYDSAGNPIRDYGTDYSGAGEENEVDNRGNYLRLKSFTLTSDITGALGVTTPVGVKLKFGDFGFGAVSVVNVAPMSTEGADGSGGTDGGIGIGVDLVILDVVTVGTVLYPENIYDRVKDDTEEPEGSLKREAPEAGVTVKASGLLDMIDVAAYFISSAHDLNEDLDGDEEDEDGMSVGASVAVAPLDGLKFGLGFEYDFDGMNADEERGIAKLQFDAAFTMVDKLAIGLSYALKDFTDAAGKSEIKLSATYDIFEYLGVYGAIAFGDFTEMVVDDIEYDVGVTSALGALKLQLGMSNNLDFKAPEDDFEDVLFLKVSASF